MKQTKFDIVKDEKEIIDIFKWISNNKYDGEYPNFQLQGTSENIKLHFQTFFGEKEFVIDDWLIDGVKYIMEVYGYKYSTNIKPISISFKIDNPNYDVINDLINDYEGVTVGGKLLKNSNKKIVKCKTFDKIEKVLNLKVSKLSIKITK
jgi:hypothetical protein